LGKHRHSDFVFLLFESGESCHNHLFFVGHQETFNRLNSNFTSVLLGYFPFKFQSNPAFILNAEFLTLRNTTEGGREEKFILRESNLWGVAEALELNSLQVGCAVVEDKLSREVKESVCFGREFKRHQRE
jgi:hypothetical protein